MLDAPLPAGVGREIIVVDDGSKDGLKADIVEDYRGGATPTCSG